MKLQLNLMYIRIVNHVRGKERHMPVLYGSQQLLQNNNAYWTKKGSTVYYYNSYGTVCTAIAKTV